MPTRLTILRGCGVGIVGIMTGPVAATSSPTGEQSFDEQLSKITEATKRYRDMERALKEGYRILGPYVPAMGWHFTNPKYAKKAAKNGPNLVEPPILTYNLTGELGAVEYAVPLDKYTNDDGEVTDSPDLFGDEDADREVKVPESEAWHPHREAQHVFSNANGEYDDGQYKRENLLNPNNWVELSDHNEMFPDTEPNLEEGDALEVKWNPEAEEPEERIVDLLTVHPSQHTLHVWVHSENPHGVLAGFNPEFDRFDPPGGGHDHEH